MYQLRIKSPTDMVRVFLAKLSMPTITGRLDLAEGALRVFEGEDADELVVEVENLLFRDFICDSLKRLEADIDLKLTKSESRKSY